MSTIIITGGCGYIGSHTAIELIKQGKHKVVSIDNFSNSEEGVIDCIEAITGVRIINHAIDLCDLKAVQEVFSQYSDIVGVIHFAAFKAVGDSVAKPLDYYHNNFETLINALRACESHGVNNFIFSSSCTVYGILESDQLPVTEQTRVQKAASPYGNTKLVGEQILEDYTVSGKPLQVISLRYFNPVGAHPSGLNGELPLGRPNNLVPAITQTAAGILPQLIVYGDDYETRDGTCIRDYIHVVDIAEAHVLAMDYLLEARNTESYEVFNLGSGEGVTVMEAIQSFEKVSGLKLNYVIGPRRPGDVPAIYSDSSRVKKLLGWQTRYDIDDMMASAWKWQVELRNEGMKE